MNDGRRRPVARTAAAAAAAAGAAYPRRASHSPLAGRPSYTAGDRSARRPHAIAARADREHRAVASSVRQRRRLHPRLPSRPDDVARPRKNPFQSSTGGEVEHAGHRSAAFRPARIAKQTVADPTTVGGETPRERAPVERMTLPRFDAVRRPENVQAADLDTRRCY